MMMQWHPQQWHLCLMVAGAMAVVVINAVVVDATANNPSSDLMDAINAASINRCFH
jgi:hypothetical protein